MKDQIKKLIYCPPVSEEVYVSAESNILEGSATREDYEAIDMFDD